MVSAHRPPALLAPALLALRVHPRLHGPEGDYIGLALAAAASWVGVPGSGEAALVAAGILAARGRLDLPSVIAVAWAAATAGGVVGWLAGRRVGGALIGAPGPLRRWRRHALARGERFYRRYGPVAVLLTPSWMAGIMRMQPGPYLAANAVSALVWALLLGLGSYEIGPTILDLASDLGLAGLIGLAVLAVAAALAARRRRRRRRIS
jgi:membrane-associated protein